MKKYFCFALTLFFLAGTGVVRSHAQTVSPAMDLIEAMGGNPPKPGLASPFKSDCDTAPGLIITDDGTIENGYSGNPSTIIEVTFLEKFTIPEPGQLTQVCLALISLSNPDLNMEVVVFDDDGPGGLPGTELAVMPASLSGLPGGTSPVVWQTIDLTSLNLILNAEPVYIGARWSPTGYPSRFIANDESAGTPMVEGYVKFEDGGGADWQSIQSVFPGYKSMFIRPQILDAPLSVPLTGRAVFAGLALILGFVLMRFFRVF